jgi:ABC-type Fe3+ transport system permease subunit
VMVGECIVYIAGIMSTKTSKTTQEVLFVWLVSSVLRAFCLICINIRTLVFILVAMQSEFKYITTTSSVLLVIIIMLFFVEMSRNVQQKLRFCKFCGSGPFTLYKKTVIFCLIFIIVFCFCFGINLCFSEITYYMIQSEYYVCDTCWVWVNLICKEVQAGC